MGKMVSFIIVEFPFHAEKKKFIVWRLRKICFLALELENRLNSRSGKHLNTNVFLCGNNNS